MSVKIILSTIFIAWVSNFVLYLIIMSENIF